MCFFLLFFTIFQQKILKNAVNWKKKNDLLDQNFRFVQSQQTSECLNDEEILFVFFKRICGTRNFMEKNLMGAKKMQKISCFSAFWEHFMSYIIVLPGKKNYGLIFLPRKIL